MVCELSVFLLDNQNKNGSFPAWFRGGKDELDTYDQIHSTWVCTQVSSCVIAESAVVAILIVHILRHHPRDRL